MKKGFTIVELAIVLVVIGIIISMGMKGKQLVDVARFKNEVIKTYKLQAALHIYLAQSKNFVRYGNYNDIDMDKVMSAGGISSKDLKSSYNKNGYEAHYSITACRIVEEAVGPLPNSMYESGSNKQTNYCGELLVYSTTSGNSASKSVLLMPLQLQCGIETLMDDESLITGMGRRAANSSSPYTVVYDDFTDETYSDCMALSSSFEYAYYEYRTMLY